MAVRRLRDVRLRPEVVLEEVPAPQRIAPYALALSAPTPSSTARSSPPGGSSCCTTRPRPRRGRGPSAWSASCVPCSSPSSARTRLLGQVGWSWLEDSLSASGVAATAVGGTVTRVVSESYGALAAKPATVELEVRASWTPLGDLARAPRRLVGAAVHRRRPAAAAGRRRAARPQALIHPAARGVDHAIPLTRGPRPSPPQDGGSTVRIIMRARAGRRVTLTGARRTAQAPSTVLPILHVRRHRPMARPAWRSE